MTEHLMEHIEQALHIVETYQKLVAEKDDFTADEMRWVIDILVDTRDEIKRLRAENEELRAAFGQRLRDLVGDFLKNEERKRYR